MEFQEFAYYNCRAYSILLAMILIITEKFNLFDLLVRHCLKFLFMRLFLTHESFKFLALDQVTVTVAIPITYVKVRVGACLISPR